MTSDIDYNPYGYPIAEDYQNDCDYDKNVLDIDDELYADVVDSINFNGTYIPGIDRVIYNIGKKSYPKLDENGKRVKDPVTKKVVMEAPIDVLTTIVYFEDNSKIVVTNSQFDGVTFEDVTLSDGSTVKTATESSKEMGLVYALAKRLVSCYDERGNMVSNGFGRRLREEVALAHDSVVEEAELKIARAKSKAEHEAKMNTGKPKKKRYSIAETLERMNNVLSKFEETFEQEMFDNKEENIEIEVK